MIKLRSQSIPIPTGRVLNEFTGIRNVDDQTLVVTYYQTTIWLWWVQSPALTRQGDSLLIVAITMEHIIRKKKENKKNLELIKYI